MSVPKSRILESPCPPSKEPGAVLFETKRLIIRRHLPTDAEALVETRNHMEVWKFMSDRRPFPFTLADAEAFLNTPDLYPETGYPGQCAILVKADAADGSPSEPLLVGGIGVRTLGNIFYRSWTLGYYMTPAQGGKGYMTEAIRGMCQFVFTTWPKVHRIDAESYNNNPGSMAVLKKSGFTQEGIRRGMLEKNGEILDMVMFGLLRDDFKPV